MITLIKIGGSLVTDKRTAYSYRAGVMQSLSQEMASLFQPGHSRWIVGHGSGSFGHSEATRYGTMDGASTAGQWRGFCQVAFAAASLNLLVWKTMLEHGLPVMRFQPSASSITENRRLQSLNVGTLATSLAHDLLPLVHGVVSFDRVQGASIASTESIFTYLAQVLPVTRIILLGEVPGVLDDRQRVISHITPLTIEAHRSSLGASAGTDVTGGMLTKVTDMLDLAVANAGLIVRIVDGTQPGNLALALQGADIGTLISAT